MNNLSHLGITESGSVTAPPKKRGCFFYGCITAIIGSAILAVIFAVVGYFGWKAIQGALTWVEQHSDTEPRQIAMVSATPEEFGEVNRRFTAFRESIDQGNATELHLTAKDLNVLIFNQPDLADLRGHVALDIRDNELRGEVSCPLDFVGLKGRYFNGSASFGVSLDNGALFVTVKDVEFKGESPPAEIMNQLRQQNLAKDIYNDPDVAKYLGKIASISIVGNEVVIKSK